jgi:hypothetical protein
MFNRVKLMMAVALGRMLGKTPLSLHRAATDHNRAVDAIRAGAGSAEAIGRHLRAGVARLMPSRGGRRPGAYWGPNGAQAMARRVRQIAAGQLTVSNGLVLPRNV